MPNLPTPIRAALGLAATAVDEARKLPETLPQAVTTVPLMAVSTAMQASLKVQQHIATLAARGDEVLSQLRGSSTKPPGWATFDEDVPAPGAEDDAQPPKAAFDLIDYDHTGFAEGAEDDEGKSRWDAVGGTQPEAEDVLDSFLALGPSASDLGATEEQFAVTATPPSAAGPTPPAAGLDEAVSAPDLPAASPARAGGQKAPAIKKAPAAKKGPAKAGPVKAGPIKAGPIKAGPIKAGPVKAGPIKAGAVKAAPIKAGAVKAGAVKAGAGPVKAGAGPAKAGPAKAGAAKATKRAGRKGPDHEPLEAAARKAKPAATPNPSTMAAEILHAHEAAADDE